MSDDQRTKSRGSAIIHIIMYTLLIGSLGGVLYLSFDNIKYEINELLENGLSITDNEDVTLDELLELEGSESEASYIQLEDDLNQTKMRLTRLELENQALEKKVVDLTSDVLKKRVIVSRNASKAKDSVNCYDMYKGSYFIPNDCRKKIIKYVDKHKDAKYFEIVGIVDTLEFELLANLEKNSFIYDKLHITQESVDALKKFGRAGLAKYRAMEASWVIKAHTKRKAVTYDVHYQLVSKKAQKGIIVRAYK